MPVYRFRYKGPNDEYLRSQCNNNQSITVVSSCDGAAMDVECDSDTIATLSDVLGFPAHFELLGEVPQSTYSGAGPHSVDTLVPMLADCRGHARIDVSVHDSITREIYAWIELRVLRATAADPTIVSTVVHHVATGWETAAVALGAAGMNLALVVTLPAGASNVLIDSRVRATRLS